MSGIPHHTDLHGGRNIYLTSWFILSVLFLTFSEMSVVPIHVQNPRSHGLHPGRNVYLTSWFILSVLYLTGCETSVVPTCVWDPPSHGPPPLLEGLPDQLVHAVCVVFDRQWDVTGTSTLVGMSTWPAGSFCLCCFLTSGETSVVPTHVRDLTSHGPPPW